MENMGFSLVMIGDISIFPVNEKKLSLLTAFFPSLKDEIYN